MDEGAPGNFQNQIISRVLVVIREPPPTYTFILDFGNSRHPFGVKNPLNCNYPIVHPKARYIELSLFSWGLDGII